MPHTATFTANRLHWNLAAFNVLALTTFGLAALCFYWYALSNEIALLLLGWVAFGTAFDFYSHLLGNFLQRYRRFLEIYARINFSALCFGIPFTVLAGSFVIAAVKPDGINAQIVSWWPQLLGGSLAFGSLFLLARYRTYSIDGSLEFTLDKSHRYTYAAFIARRIYLAVSLIIPTLVLIDSLGTEWFLWAVAFAISFVATVPLHILHKQLPSMLCEAVTLYILVFGSYAVFLT